MEITRIILYCILGIIINIGLWGLIIYLIVSIPRPFEKKVEKIRNQFPLAYRNFIDKNHISSYSDKIFDLWKIAKRPFEIWNEEEEKLQEQERKRRELDIQYKEIEKTFSEGLKKWRRLNPSTTKEIVISNKYKIKDYDTIIKKRKNLTLGKKNKRSLQRSVETLLIELCQILDVIHIKCHLKRQTMKGKALMAIIKFGNHLQVHIVWRPIWTMLTLSV